MENFKVAKIRHPDTCDASRCQQRWTRPLKNGVKLCDRHLQMLTHEEALEFTRNQEHDYFDEKSAPTKEQEVKQEIELYSMNADEALTALKDFEISDQEEADQISEIMRRAHDDYKRLDDMRKKVTKPILEAKKGIDAWFKPTTNKLEALKVLLKEKIQTWIDSQTQQYQEALDSGDAETILAAPNPELPSGTATRNVWEIEIVNFELVPRRYLILDESAVRADMDRLGPENVVVPGLEIKRVERVILGRSS